MSNLLYHCSCSEGLVRLESVGGVYYKCPNCGKQIMYFYNQKSKGAA